MAAFVIAVAAGARLAAADDPHPGPMPPVRLPPGSGPKDSTVFLDGRSRPAKTALLAWLNGCWRLEDAKRVVEEEWSAPDSIAMVGVGREYRKPKLAKSEEEHTRIELRGGHYIYLAVPADQPPDSFPSIEASDKRVVFENKAHDFPQRIGYERVTADSVLAWVEGPGKDGATRRIEYPYHRVRCGTFKRP